MITNKLKEVSIKNGAYCYLIDANDLDFRNILVSKVSYKDRSIYYRK